MRISCSVGGARCNEQIDITHRGRGQSGGRRELDKVGNSALAKVKKALIATTGP
jgi:hypothetical protein